MEGFSSLPRKLAAPSLAILALFLLLGAILARLLPCPSPDTYLVLLDAGSVHTSIYTYRLNGPNVLVPVEEVGFCELGQVGVSSFAESPHEAADYLASHHCLASAVSLVPNVSRPYSSVVLGGTAGLRVLRLATPQLASQILGNITAALSSVASGMKTSARILPGLEEAQDGWVTANYLAGSFEVGNKVGTEVGNMVGNMVGNDVGNEVGNKETQPRGALDWGGASAQVTALAPSTNWTSKDALEEEANKALVIEGITYDLFLSSHLCYGQAEAVKRHRAELVYQLYLDAGHSLPTPLQVSDPCLPKEANLSISLASLFSSPCTQYKDSSFVKHLGRKLATNVTLVPGDLSLCQASVAKAFDPLHCLNRYIQPKEENICLDPATIPPPTNQTYFAFSTYWYLTTSMRLNRGPVSNPFTFTKAKYDESLLAICNSSLPKLKQDPKEDGWGLRETVYVACFQANFLEALLSTGYHFSPEQWSNIIVVKRLGQPPAEVGWTLGQALLEASDDEQEDRACISLLTFVILLSCALLLGVTSAACACLIRRNNPREGYNTLP